MVGHSTQSTTRRDVFNLAGAAGLAFGGTGLSVVPAEAGAPLSGDPAASLALYMMMRGALDDRLVIGCLTGRYYGVVDARLKPLFGLASATFSRYRPAADGGFIGISYEVAYFTELETGEVLDVFANPYTGASVTIAPNDIRPTKFHVGADLSLTRAMAPGVQMEHQVGETTVQGDRVGLTETTSAVVEIPGQSRPLCFNELLTFGGSLAELTARSATRARCDVSYTSVSSWRPWMGMGDRPGELLGVAAGLQGAAMAMLPAGWLKATAKRHPEVLEAPEHLLEPLWRAPE